MGRERWLFPAMAICVAAVIIAAWLSSVTGYPPGLRFRWRFALIAVIVAVTGFARFLAYLWKLYRAGVDNPIAHIRKDWPQAMASFGSIVLGMVLIGFFIQSISQIKAMIPAIVPYYADGWLLAFDRAVIGNPETIAAIIQPIKREIGVFYMLWHVVNLGGVVWVLHWKSESRGRLVIAYMLTWSVGMAIAYLGSSMGPIFTGAFDPSLAPGTTQQTSSVLWEVYQARGVRMGAGISAFPSMHVAIATWFYFVLREKGWPKSGLAYVAAVFVCSIITGWHYSLDGVAGAAIAVGCYVLSASLDQFRSAKAVNVSHACNVGVPA